MAETLWGLRQLERETVDGVVAYIIKGAGLLVGSERCAVELAPFQVSGKSNTNER